MSKPPRPLHEIEEKRIGELDTTEHIFGNSPTMLGLCLTGIGLIKIYAGLARISTLADNLLAVAVVAFLFSTVFSYLALRTITPVRRSKLTRVADITFLFGLCSTGAVSVFITFTLAG